MPTARWFADKPVDTANAHAGTTVAHARHDAARFGRAEGAVGEAARLELARTEAEDGARVRDRAARSRRDGHRQRQCGPLAEVNAPDTDLK
jgi:hypothetical protein